MGLRTQRRVRQNLGLSYTTPPEKIEAFCENVRYLIIQCEKVVKDSVSVSFNAYTEASLNILVNFHIATNDANEESQIQQKVFFEILSLAKNMQVDFAFPNQTAYQKSNSDLGRS